MEPFTIQIANNGTTLTWTRATLDSAKRFAVGIAATGSATYSTHPVAVSVTVAFSLVLRGGGGVKAIQFKVSTRTIEYGDKRKFVEYQIIFQASGKPVGIEIGPRRQTATRSECISASRKRIAKLRKHRLVVIPVTSKHIRDGQARSCSRCAIAEALYCKQAEMGFPQNEYSFEVSTYGAFVDPRGIELKPASWVQGKDLAIPIEKIPKILAWVSPKGRAYSEDMATWTMNWDDWAEARYMSAKEWRDERGDEKPRKPGPCSFVLDLDEFKPVSEEAAV